MSKNGKIFVISAPSGSGKTTLCRRLLESGVGLARSVSATTRPKRPGEINGRDYRFVSEGDFKKWIRQGKFLEWTKTYGWYYGTPKGPVVRLLKTGKDMLFNIDVKGAMNIKKDFPESVLIFILPPSLKELKERLKKRNADGKKEVEKRLRIAAGELAVADRYDYCVVNDRILQALQKLNAIVIAERCRTKWKDC